jgi:hypothetical protein
VHSAKTMIVGGSEETPVCLASQDDPQHCAGSSIIAHVGIKRGQEVPVSGGAHLCQPESSPCFLAACWRPLSSHSNTFTISGRLLCFSLHIEGPFVRQAGGAIPRLRSPRVLHFHFPIPRCLSHFESFKTLPALRSRSLFHTAEPLIRQAGGAVPGVRPLHGPHAHVRLRPLRQLPPAVGGAGRHHFPGHQQRPHDDRGPERARDSRDAGEPAGDVQQAGRHARALREWQTPASHGADCGLFLTFVTGLWMSKDMLEESAKAS